MAIRLLCLLGCLFFGHLIAEEAITGITVDLREPEYADGVVSTSLGGVIRAPYVRIQAQNIRYTHDTSGEVVNDTVVAEGDVRFESFSYLFVGQKLEYNLTNQTGFIYYGKTSVYPWFFGGKLIQICADGSYIIYDGYMTSSESMCPEWMIAVDTARIYPNHDLVAKQIKVKVKDFPLFWAPKFCANLDTLCDMPVKFTLRWGGKQGSRVGVSYELLSWENLSTLLRLDYNLKRGLGTGGELHYRSPENNEKFDSINYFAHEVDPANPHINTRYRFQGRYLRFWRDGKTLFEMKYDKLSDKMMATDYSDRGLDLEYARKTDLLLHHQQRYWLGNLLIRPRINSFQTIKQELPTFSTASLPLSNALGIISSFQANASYLDFQYAQGAVNVHDFTATRVELHSGFYRPFGNGYAKIIPGLNAIGIFYGNKPYHGQYWLAAGLASLDGELLLSRDYGWGRHVVRPYFNYNYLTQPTIPPDSHYIFDISDGIYRMNTLRFGTVNYFLDPFSGSCQPIVFLDTYGWALMDNKKIPHPLPYFTANLSFMTFGVLQNSVLATWDLSHGGFGELNFKSAWTVSRNLATSLEYRQRNAFFWRKVDRENFVLDFFRSENELLHSPLSDQRRTLLLHFFYRINYDVALEWNSRFGWDRRHEPHYFEYDVNILASLPAHWEMKLSFQHKEVDDRFAVYFSFGTEQR